MKEKALDGYARVFFFFFFFLHSDSFLPPIQVFMAKATVNPQHCGLEWPAAAGSVFLRTVFEGANDAYITCKILPGAMSPDEPQALLVRQRHSLPLVPVPCHKLQVYWPCVWVPEGVS